MDSNHDFHGPRSRPQRPMFDQMKGSSSSGYSEEFLYRSSSSSSQRASASSGYSRQGTAYISQRTAAAKKQQAARRQRRRKRAKGAALIVLCVFLAIVLGLAGGIYMLINWASDQIRGEETEAGSLTTEIKSTNIPEYTGKGIITALICGIDYNDEDARGYMDEANKIGRTDLILYMMYDTVNNKANFLQIPRDVYVGEELNTGGTGKINGLYYWAEDADNRMQALADALYQQLALPTDFYVTLDMDAVKELIDTVGSIAVYVPQDIKDPTPGSSAVMEAGWRHFNGEQAEFFLRNRNYADADLTRLQMQQSFYSALFREFKRLAPQDLVMWMQVLLQRAKIGGIEVLQLGGLAQKALTIESADITFVRPSVAGAMRGSSQLVCLVPEEMADVLNQYFRPAGYEVPVEELDIQTLPIAPHIGKSETAVRTMGDIAAQEPALPS